MSVAAKARAKGRPWSKRDEAFLRRNVRRMFLCEIAELLDRTEIAVKSRCKVLGLQYGDYRYWTPEEEAILRRDYRRVPASQIAEALGRKKTQIFQKAKKLGLAADLVVLSDDQVRQAIAKFHPEGYSDTELGRELLASTGVRVNRHRIGRLRRELGLPDNALSERRRRQIGEKTREMLAEKGLDSLAEVRVEAFREFARRQGWPEDLWPRAVQILSAIYEQGPMTRRQIAVAIGKLPPEEAQTVSNDRLNQMFLANRRRFGGGGGDNSYFGELIARGFLLSRKRAAKAKGKGRSQDVYFIPLSIRRGEPSTWPEAATPS